MENDLPSKGRLLSEELGERLYGALRERILMNRAATKKREEDESASSSDSGSESDCQNSPSTLEEVAKNLKGQINRLSYMKKVKRGMVQHLEHMKEREMDQAGSDSTEEVVENDKRKKAKSRALMARKGARSSQNIRRYSPIANRLRRRALPNKRYFSPKKHT